MKKTAWQSFRETLRNVIGNYRDGFTNIETMRASQVQLRRSIEHYFDRNGINVERALAKDYKVLMANAKKNIVVPGRNISSLSSLSRRELIRRMAASEALIKTRRTEAVEKALARLVGWGTAQGVQQEKKASVKDIEKDIAKGVKSFSYEERRILIDQTAKMNADVNYLFAKEGKAIAARWRSNVGRLNYNHRKEHLAREGNIYTLKNGWAYEKGLINKGAGFYEELEDPVAKLPYCSCYIEYIYSLRRLPPDMLTEKGKKAWTIKEKS